MLQSTTPTASYEVKSALDMVADIYVNAASVYTNPLEVADWGGFAGAVRQRLTDPTSSNILRKDWEDRGKSISPGTADFVRDDKRNPILLNWGQNKTAYLIHAGAPIKSESKNPSQELKDAYSAILQQALQLQKTTVRKPLTISCPPLGIGIYGNDPTVSAKAAVEAFKEFKKQNPNAQINLKFGIMPTDNNLKFRQTFEKELNSLTADPPVQETKSFTPASDKTHNPVPIASQSSMTIGALKGYLEENKTKYNIKQVTSSSNNLVLDMTNNSKVYISEKTETHQPPSLEYAVQKTNDREKQIETITNICKLAVDSAKPGTIFNLLNKDEELNAITQAALVKAIQNHRPPYTEDNPEPKIYSSDKALIKVPTKNQDKVGLKFKSR